MATLFFSPDKSIQDLADYGITTDNSSLQNRDYYKNIPAIQEAFTDDRGNFDNAKYNKFYDDALYLYNEAETNNIIGNMHILGTCIRTNQAMGSCTGKPYIFYF